MSNRNENKSYAISLKHFAAAAMVFSMSDSLCAAETKAVSN